MVAFDNQLSFVDAILKIFNNDFLNSNNRPKFNGQKVFLKKSPKCLFNGTEYDWSFYHIITKESTISKIREFDQDRAERIPYPRHFIDQATTLKVWTKPDGGDRLKYYICDDSFEYMVILSERKNYIMLLSGFPLGKSYSLKMQKEYKNYKNSP